MVVPITNKEQNKQYQKKWAKENREFLKDTDPVAYARMLERRRLSNLRYRSSKKYKDAEKAYAETRRQNRFRLKYGSGWELKYIDYRLKEFLDV